MIYFLRPSLFRVRYSAVQKNRLSVLPEIYLLYQLVV
jgi:hypothetical protein